MFANQWNNLLHYSNNENQITSREFFLSNINNPTPKEELFATIDSLNSKDGEIIACNFPARYNFLKSKEYDIPAYNLSDCAELNNFVNNFGKDKISLIFTSEHTNNPSSAFGHTMIVFHNKNESFEIADAVHFAADTSQKDSFISYSYKGFNGKYKGYFLREPFYKKMYEYNTLEQRYMYTYTLDFTKEQILQIIYHLFELRKATFKYYFLNGNCATQTTDLLNVISDKERDAQIYYLPIDTIKEFENNIISRSKYIPLLNKLNLLINKMSKNEKNLFNKIIKTNEDLKKNDPNIVKEAMVYYSTFYFRRFHRVYKNYDNVMEQIYTKDSIIDNSLNPLEKTQASNFGLGYYTQKDGDYLSMNYRPLFIDMNDIQLNNMQQSEVSTFTFDFIFNNETIKLKELDLFNLKAYSNQTNYYKPISWSIYSGLNRENKDDKIKFNNQVAMGKTSSVFNTSIFNTMFSLGIDNTYLYIKPIINFNTNLNNYSKIGFSSEYKYYLKNYYYKNKAFITLKDNQIIYQAKYENDNSKNPNKILFSIKYNF